jgi:hypothetical protein
MLAYQILTFGRHLDLIFWVDEQNRRIPAKNKSASGPYHVALDNALVEAGVIAQRPSLAAKPHFIRDEPKLWNKLRLLVRDGVRSYFHRNYGFVFDWRKIVSIIDNKSNRRDIGIDLNKAPSFAVTSSWI